MGFGILIRDPSETHAGIFEALLEDTAYSLVDLKEDTDWASPEALNARFAKRAPKAIVNFLPDNLSTLNQHDVDALSVLAQVSLARDIPIVHISSYRVFGEPYVERGWRESDIPEPEDSLGQMLLALEQSAAENPKHLILRTSWILENAGSGLLGRFIEPMLKHQSFVASDHRYGSPLPRGFIVKAVFAMIQQILCGAENWGIFHVHSSDKCSEAEFADQLFRLLSNEFKLVVEAPTVAGVDDHRHLVAGCGLLQGRRCTGNFGIQLPTWRSGFARVVKAWLDEAGGQEETQEP